MPSAVLMITPLHRCVDDLTFVLKFQFRKKLGSTLAVHENRCTLHHCTTAHARHFKIKKPELQNPKHRTGRIDFSRPRPRARRLAYCTSAWIYFRISLPVIS